jgi:hypothetical protein
LGLRPEFWLQGQWRPSYTSVCDSCCELVFWLDDADATVRGPLLHKSQWACPEASPAAALFIPGGYRPRR